MEYFAVAAALFALLAMLLAGLSWRAAARGPADEQLAMAFRRGTETLFNQHRDSLEKVLRAEAAPFLADHARTEGLQQLDRAIRAARIHCDDLVAESQRLKRGAQGACAIARDQHG